MGTGETERIFAKQICRKAQHLTETVPSRCVWF